MNTENHRPRRFHNYIAIGRNRAVGRSPGRSPKEGGRWLGQSEALLKKPGPVGPSDSSDQLPTIGTARLFHWRQNMLVLPRQNKLVVDRRKFSPQRRDRLPVVTYKLSTTKRREITPLAPFCCGVRGHSEMNRTSAVMVEGNRSRLCQCNNFNENRLFDRETTSRGLLQKNGSQWSSLRHSLYQET